MSVRRRRLAQTRARERVRSIRTKQESRRDYHYGIYLSSPEGSNCGEEWGPDPAGKMSFSSWMVVVSASTSPSPMSYVGHSSYKGLGSKIFEFDRVDYWDRVSESSISNSYNDLISPTTTSEADDDERRSDISSPLSVSSSSPEGPDVSPLQLGPRRKSSIRSLSQTLSPATAWGFSTFLVASPPKQRRGVLFNGTDRVVLIPARSDYDDETKAEMWWSFSDYNEFQKTAKIDFERCGHDWSQLPEEEVDMVASLMPGSVKAGEEDDQGETDVALSEILSEEEEHAALVSFLSHKPLYRPDSPHHGNNCHSTLPSSLALATGAVEVECDEEVKRVPEEGPEKRLGLSHSWSSPALCIDTRQDQDFESSRPLYEEAQQQQQQQENKSLPSEELPDLPVCDGSCHKQHFSPRRLFSPRCSASPQRLCRIVDTLDLASVECGNSDNLSRPSRRSQDYASKGTGRRSLDDMHEPTACEEWSFTRRPSR